GRHRLRGPLAHAVQPGGRGGGGAQPRERGPAPRRRPPRRLRGHRRRPDRAEARGVLDRGDDRPDGGDGPPREGQEDLRRLPPQRPDVHPLGAVRQRQRGGRMTGDSRDRVRPAYLLLFASLYAIQGVVVAYFFNYNQGYMKVAGVDDKT